jgi:hypothetical protein
MTSDDHFVYSAGTPPEAFCDDQVMASPEAVFAAVSAAVQDLRSVLQRQPISVATALVSLDVLEERLDGFDLPLESAAHATTLDHDGVWLWNTSTAFPTDLDDRLTAKGALTHELQPPSSPRAGRYIAALLVEAGARQVTSLRDLARTLGLFVKAAESLLNAGDLAAGQQALQKAADVRPYHHDIMVYSRWMSSSTMSTRRPPPVKARQATARSCPASTLRELDWCVQDHQLRHF